MDGTRLIVVMMILYSASNYHAELAPTSSTPILLELSQGVIHSEIVDNFVRGLPLEIRKQLILNDEIVSTSAVVELVNDAVEDAKEELTSVQNSEITNIIKSDISTEFRNFKNLLPDWAIIACAVAVSLFFMILMILIAYKRSGRNKLSNQIQSLSFQSLQDLTLAPEMMNSTTLKPLDTTRVSSLDGMSLYDIGYTHIYGNDVSSSWEFQQNTPKSIFKTNTWSKNDVSSSWELQQNTQKSIFKTNTLSKTFSKFKKSNNFKHMDDLLEAYHSLDITECGPVKSIIPVSQTSTPSAFPRKHPRLSTATI